MQHSVHDTTLIASLAAGDLADSELERAKALLTSCGDCAELHRDLIAIAAATRALPTLATAPRDFRIDATRAARLTRGSWLRGFLRPFGAAGSATRPLAAAFTSLGVAGLLVFTVLPGFVGGPAMSTGAERDLNVAGAPAPSTAAVAPQAGGPGAAASQAPDRAELGSNQYAAGQSGDPKDIKSGSPAPTDAAALVALGNDATPKAAETDSSLGVAQAPRPNLLLIGSLALLAVGVALFGLRFAGRRLR